MAQPINPPRAKIQQDRRMKLPRLGGNQGHIPGSQAIERRTRNALLDEIGCRMKQARNSLDLLALKRH